MAEKTELAPQVIFALWSALLLLLAIEVLGMYVGFSSGTECFVTVLLISVVLLVVVSNTSQNSEAVPRIVLGSWLALLLLYGLEDVRRTISWFSGARYDSSPWLGYFVVGLVIGVVLLVATRKPVATLGGIRFTLYTGFLIILANYVNDFVFGGNWLSMFDRLSYPDQREEWWRFAYWWYYNPDWVRLITYLGFGYLVARRARLLLGIVSSILLALADSILSWLVVIAFGLRIYSELWDHLHVLWPEMLRPLVLEASILAFFGLIGALSTQVRWPQLSQSRRVSSIG